MCVWLSQLAIRQRVVVIVKLCDIAAKVLSDRELATWMDSFIAVGAQDKVVTND